MSSKRGSGSYTDLTKFLLRSASSPREMHLRLRSSSASSQLSRSRFERCVLSLSHSSSRWLAKAALCCSSMIDVFSHMTQSCNSFSVLVTHSLSYASLAFSLRNSLFAFITSWWYASNSSLRGEGIGSSSSLGRRSALSGEMPLEIRTSFLCLYRYSSRSFLSFSSCFRVWRRWAICLWRNESGTHFCRALSKAPTVCSSSCSFSSSSELLSSSWRLDSVWASSATSSSTRDNVLKASFSHSGNSPSPTTWQSSPPSSPLLFVSSSSLRALSAAHTMQSIGWLRSQAAALFLGFWRLLNE